MNELYESVDKNKLCFEYVGNTKDVSFYEYMNSRELFNELKDNRIRFDEALKERQELLKKKIKQKQVIKLLNNKVVDNPEKFYHSREEVFSFFKDYTKILFDASCEAKQDETKGTGLQILIPKQMLQRQLITFVQVKVGNNSEIY